MGCCALKECAMTCCPGGEILIGGGAGKVAGTAVPDTRGTKVAGGW